jgi:hypothetical protein
MRFVPLALVIFCAQWTFPPDPDPHTQTYRRLAQQRARMIAWLKEYRNKGEFPYRSDDSTPGEPIRSKTDPHFGSMGTHYFIGPNKALCAVANLIAQSGRRDLVDRIAKENNHFCVAEAKEDPIMDWILNSGLTLEECILIQLPAPAEVVREPETEAQRLQQHLDSVVRILDQQTRHSLQIAMQRLEARLDH